MALIPEHISFTLDELELLYDNEDDGVISKILYIESINNAHRSAQLRYGALRDEIYGQLKKSGFDQGKVLFWRRKILSI
jgi:hypothetical protein